jgi:uncharacterized protein (DUF433 family)
MGRMRWQERVVIAPDLHHGDPCIKGTRIPVAMIVGSLADGMTPEEIRAAYLLRPLKLREHQTVWLQLLPEEPAEDEGEEAIRILVAAGLMRPPQRGTPPPDPVSEEERRALAERLAEAPGKPLSEIIIEDRGEWYLSLLGNR